LPVQTGIKGIYILSKRAFLPTIILLLFPLFTPMLLSNTILIRTAILAVVCSFLTPVHAQQVTGVWKGKINKKNAEVKIIQNGDSLTGTSYYYESASNYRRYTIKGYFDQNDNSVVWWDDQLIEDKSSSGAAGKTPILAVADFNCPGGREMYLNGRASPKENPNQTKGLVDLTKTVAPYFPDEWDFVVDNYTIGANDPDIIDSVFLIAFTQIKWPVQKPDIREEEPETLSPIKPGMAVIPMPGRKTIDPEIKPLTIEEKFTSREKVVALEIPVEGDSVELRFYDNAEIDGDSISLFLNNQMLFTHIRLTDKAYTVKLSVNDLRESNELTMVAENLGSIPPNTSFMVAIVGDKRYEAKLASTENSSAMIRLKKTFIHEPSAVSGNH
jgi:hypothetical protein